MNVSQSSDGGEGKRRSLMATGCPVDFVDISCICALWSFSSLHVYQTKCHERCFQNHSPQHYEHSAYCLTVAREHIFSYQTVYGIQSKKLSTSSLLAHYFVLMYFYFYFFQISKRDYFSFIVPNISNVNESKNPLQFLYLYFVVNSSKYSEALATCSGSEKLGKRNYIL